MKKTILLGLVFLAVSNIKLQAQTQNRVITTGVPFLLIAADAKAAGMGDQGVATKADAFSQQWNPAKYAFVNKQMGVGVNYTPYLSSLVNDIGLGSLYFYNRLNERSAVAASFKYFSLGEIEFRENAIVEGLIQKPNELTIDISYALKLDEHISMAVAGRYLRSDLKLSNTPQGGDATSGGSFGVDIAGFYQSDEIAYSSFNGRWRAGANISNIGPKIKYDAAGQENFLPTNFRAGVGFDFLLDEFNRITPSLEFSKLLVPTPLDPDTNKDGLVSTEEQNAANIKYNNTSEFGAIFSSWGDAPGGFSEELKEFTWSLGTEYMYRDVFAFRAGYFNESEEKGARKFLSIGAGFKYSIVNIDISYLFSTSAVQSPLEGTLRFGLSFNFGEDYFDR